MRNTIFVANQNNGLVCHLASFSYADNMNIVYKNLSGKSDERDVKLCKT